MRDCCHPLNLLRKQLQFKKLAFVEICSSCVSLGLAVLAAAKGCGVWSLVIMQISISVLKTLLLWIVSSWRPILVFSMKSFRELFKFGDFILLLYSKVSKRPYCKI
ncbi:MAG: oligosaccharide flippase family protein [Bacteroidaceae bacterium]|nr:oligosaccharide flippase family protein [Bacteroidaceae bacterium]